MRNVNLEENELTITAIFQQHTKEETIQTLKEALEVLEQEESDPENDEMIEIMNQKIKDNKVNITVRRNNKDLSFQINLVKEDGVYKTGLYIKDRITGIGTLTYIDPKTKVYGALGHEITSSHDGKIIDISSGKIFKAIITGNTKSTNNRTGEKNAVFESSKIFGTIKENTIRGIYGLYTESLDKENLIDIAEKNEVSLGSVVTISYDDGEEEEYKIVGSMEADPFDNKISNESPLGIALLKHKIGDAVEVASPNGGYTIKIVKIA